ncbi:hypothetical protein JCM5350_001488 [Sporobolomyces pararoseus]
MQLRSSTQRTNQTASLAKPNSTSRKTTTLRQGKRKSAAACCTPSRAGAEAFKKLKSVPKEELPPNLISSFSKYLLRKCTIDGNYMWEGGCIFSFKAYNESRKRPTINLSNTRLKERYLKPIYRHLANSELYLRHLAVIINHRDSPEGASFTYKASVQPKLAQLSYLLSRPEVSPEKIGIKDVSHRCGNRSCIAPNHLVLESRKENLSREKCFGKPGKKGKKWLEECPHQPRCILSPKPKPTPPSSRELSRYGSAYVLVPPLKRKLIKLTNARKALVKREIID